MTDATVSPSCVRPGWPVRRCCVGRVVWTRTCYLTRGAWDAPLAMGSFR